MGARTKKAMALLFATGLGLVACADGNADGAAIDVAEAADGDAGGAADAIDEKYLPRFTDDGRLAYPEGWESWTLAGTSMGLTYAENPRTFAAGEAPGSFLNVYVQPWAYERFMEDGEFAEGTMFILAGSRPVSKADPARGGFYQGDLHLMEVHLKQEGLHESGWGFFGYGMGGEEPAEQIAGDASCYSCHAENADHDHVFAQFYPMMRARLDLPDPTAEESAPAPEPPAQTEGM